MDLPLYRPSPPPPRNRRPIPFVSLSVACVLVVVWSITRSLIALAVGVVALAVTGWVESTLLGVLQRRCARRRFRREIDEFDADFRDALARDRRDLLARSRAANGVIIGRGSVLSRVRVHDDTTSPVHDDMPLVVRAPGRIRVFGPVGVASILTRSLRERSPEGGGISVEIGGNSSPREHATDTTEIWLGPDGAALARSARHAGGAWVEVAPCAN